MNAAELRAEASSAREAFGPAARVVIAAGDLLALLDRLDRLRSDLALGFAEHEALGQ